MDRIKLTDEQVNQAINMTLTKLHWRLTQKGKGTFASIHEILGMATEEYKEIIDAIHSDNYNDIKEELMDMAIGCIFGVACIEAEIMDW